MTARDQGPEIAVGVVDLLGVVHDEEVGHGSGQPVGYGASQPVGVLARSVVGARALSTLVPKEAERGRAPGAGRSGDHERAGLEEVDGRHAEVPVAQPDGGPCRTTGQGTEIHAGWERRHGGRPSTRSGLAVTGCDLGRGEPEAPDL